MTQTGATRLTYGQVGTKAPTITIVTWITVHLALHTWLFLPIPFLCAVSWIWNILISKRLVGIYKQMNLYIHAHTKYRQASATIIQEPVLFKHCNDIALQIMLYPGNIMWAKFAITLAKPSLCTDSSATGIPVTAPCSAIETLMQSTARAPRMAPATRITYGQAQRWRVHHSTEPWN